VELMAMPQPTMTATSNGMKKRYNPRNHNLMIV